MPKCQECIVETADKKCSHSLCYSCCFKKPFVPGSCSWHEWIRPVSSLPSDIQNQRIALQSQSSSRNNTSISYSISNRNSTTSSSSSSISSPSMSAPAASSSSPASPEVLSVSPSLSITQLQQQLQQQQDVHQQREQQWQERFDQLQQQLLRLQQPVQVSAPAAQSLPAQHPMAAPDPPRPHSPSSSVPSSSSSNSSASSSSSSSALAAAAAMQSVDLANLSTQLAAVVARLGRIEDRQVSSSSSNANAPFDASNAIAASAPSLGSAPLPRHHSNALGIDQEDNDSIQSLINSVLSGSNQSGAAATSQVSQPSHSQVGIHPQAGPHSGFTNSTGYNHAPNIAPGGASLFSSHLAPSDPGKPINLAAALSAAITEASKSHRPFKTIEEFEQALQSNQSSVALRPGASVAEVHALSRYSLYVLALARSHGLSAAQAYHYTVAKDVAAGHHSLLAHNSHFHPAAFAEHITMAATTATKSKSSSSRYGSHSSSARTKVGKYAKGSCTLHPESTFHTTEQCRMSKPTKK
jgi:hypothetical protein